MRKQFTLLALLILILPILFLTNSFNKEQKNTYLSRAELNDDQSPPMPANIITPTLYCLGACPTIALSVEPTEVMPTISSSPSQPPTVPSDTPTDDPCGTAPSSKENKNSVKATSDKGCTDQGGKCQSRANDSCSSGKWDSSNICTGGADRQCCLPKSSSGGSSADKKCNDKGGKCQSRANDSCSGSWDSSPICAGGNDRQCCIPKDDDDDNDNPADKKCNDKGGVCQSRANDSCSGSWDSSPICGGGNDRQCCIEDDDSDDDDSDDDDSDDDDSDDDDSDDDDSDDDTSDDDDSDDDDSDDDDSDDDTSDDDDSDDDGGNIYDNPINIGGGGGNFNYGEFLGAILDFLRQLFGGGGSNDTPTPDPDPDPVQPSPSIDPCPDPNAENLM